MTTACTRCDSTGFLNIWQVPDDIRDKGTDEILEWVDNTRHVLNVDNDCQVCDCRVCIDDRREPFPEDELNHDVQVCDCCGDGESWYGTPGEHYGPDDPPGPGGPYDYNGGLCECH